MCEIGLTQGLSLEGFLEFKKRKYGEPKKLTRQQWLNQFKDCNHCSRAAHCHGNKIGYFRYCGEGAHVNGTMNGGAYKECCHWDADITNELYGKVEQLIEEGEVI